MFILISFVIMNLCTTRLSRHLRYILDLMKNLKMIYTKDMHADKAHKLRITQITMSFLLSLAFSIRHHRRHFSLPNPLFFYFFYFGQTPIPYLSLHILYLSQYYPTTISLHSAKPTQKHPISSSDQKEKKSPQYCPNNSTLCRAPPLPQRPPWCNTGSSS